MSEYLYVRNWYKFQHYKKRRPVWIKFYTWVLDDKDINSLTPTEQSYLFKLWLLASEKQGKIVYDLAWIAKRLRIYHRQSLMILLAKLQVKVLITKEDTRGDARESLTPTSSLFNKEEPNTTTREEQFPYLPGWIPPETWGEYRKMRVLIKKPMSDDAVRLAILKLDKLRNLGYSPREVLEESILNSWQGLFPLKNGNGNGHGGQNGQRQFSHQNHAISAPEGKYEGFEVVVRNK